MADHSREGFAESSPALCGENLVAGEAESGGVGEKK